MKNILSIKKLYELKHIMRASSVKERKESSAEHSWSCLLLADYFLSVCDVKLDRLKVYELLMYHDLVEIEAGDTPLAPDVDREEKVKLEMAAMRTLTEHIPSLLKDKFIALFNEFEDRTTPEAKFANAIDKLDAVIQELDHKEDWKGWTEEFLRESKEPHFKGFPEIQEEFDVLMGYFIENGYFDQ